jgi:OPA family glycerol-3-phosphate transporter-like MFS transporter
VSANVVIGYVVDSAGWDAGFSLIAASCVIAVILISFTWNAERRLIPAKGAV